VIARGAGDAYCPLANIVAKTHTIPTADKVIRRSIIGLFLTGVETIYARSVPQGLGNLSGCNTDADRRNRTKEEISLIIPTSTIAPVI